MVALLFQTPPEPIVPLWEVRLELQEDNTTGSAQTTGEGCNQHSCESSKKQEATDSFVDTEDTFSPSHCVSFAPSANDFNSAFARLLKEYEVIITGFNSLLNDERVLPYVSRSRFDLLMLLEEADKGSGGEGRGGGGKPPPWPDVPSLLWEYVPYQCCVDYIKKVLEGTMAEVTRLAVVSSNTY